MFSTPRRSRDDSHYISPVGVASHLVLVAQRGTGKLPSVLYNASTPRMAAVQISKALIAYNNASEFYDAAVLGLYAASHDADGT